MSDDDDGFVERLRDNWRDLDNGIKFREALARTPTEGATPAKRETGKGLRAALAAYALLLVFAVLIPLALGTLAVGLVLLALGIV